MAVLSGAAEDAAVPSPRVNRIFLPLSASVNRLMETSSASVKLVNARGLQGEVGRSWQPKMLTVPRSFSSHTMLAPAETSDERAVNER